MTERVEMREKKQRKKKGLASSRHCVHAAQDRRASSAVVFIAKYFSVLWLALRYSQRSKFSAWCGCRPTNMRRVFSMCAFPRLSRHRRSLRERVCSELALDGCGTGMSDHLHQRCEPCPRTGRRPCRPPRSVPLLCGCPP